MPIFDLAGKFAGLRIQTRVHSAAIWVNQLVRHRLSQKPNYPVNSWLDYSSNEVQQYRRRERRHHGFFSSIIALPVCTRNKSSLALCHLLLVLFAHRSPEEIGLASEYPASTFAARCTCSDKFHDTVSVGADPPSAAGVRFNFCKPPFSV